MHFLETAIVNILCCFLKLNPFAFPKRKSFPGIKRLDVD